MNGSTTFSTRNRLLSIDVLRNSSTVPRLSTGKNTLYIAGKIQYWNEGIYAGS